MADSARRAFDEKTGYKLNTMNIKLHLPAAFCLTVGMLIFGATSAQNLIEGKPEDVGLSTARLLQIDVAVKDAIAKNWFPGAAVLIARNGKIVYRKAFGVNDIDTKSPLRTDGIFRIASQTKAITSVAVMMLMEEGKIGLDDPLSKYIPEFKTVRILTAFNQKDSSYTARDYNGEVTIRHLLTHTSGIDYPFIGSPEFIAIYAKAGIPSGLDAPMENLGVKMKALGKLPLKHAPGEAWTYGLSVDVLGYVVEVASGMSLDQFFRKHIFEPIGMNDTYFYLPRDKQNRLVVAYADDKGVPVKLDAKQVLDPNYPALEGKYYSGGGGLSSTLDDYAKFLQLFINNGKYNGHQVLTKKTIDLMMTCQTPDMGMQFGLGFLLATPKNDQESPTSVGSFSWGGAFSTSYWGDPKEKLVCLIYEQVIGSSHPELNRQLPALVYQAITDKR